MTTTDISRGDPPYPPEHVRWKSEDVGHATRRAPTRGTEMLGAAVRATVALRAPGVVMIPPPAAGGKDEPSDLPATGLAQPQDPADVGHSRRRRRHPRQGPRPPAAVAGPPWLVDRRARDQRHHGRRGRAAEALPRHPDRGGAGGDGRLDQVAAARRRHLGQLLRRPRRPVHHGRGLRGAQAGGRPGRRAAHEARRRLDHGKRRPHRDPRLHQDLARHQRPVVLG